MENKTYIIIVTYNGMQWLDRCIKSCSEFSTIVIDNGSNDGTCSIIEDSFPDVCLLRQSENLGFGQANNIGISYALEQGAEHVFLLNQDAYLVDDVLEKLVVFQKENAEYGIVSPTHITNSRNKLDKNFSRFMHSEITGQFYSDFVLGNTIKQVYDVPFVNAAAWLISKHCLQTVGGFDPLFFHYCEDDNYCQRVLYHGLKIGVLPKSYIIHDRAHRKRKLIVEFSEAYYQNKLRDFKLKQSNILHSESIDRKILKHKKTILMLFIQFKFVRARAHKKELDMLIQVKPDVLRSREINVKRDKHYLS